MMVIKVVMSVDLHGGWLDGFVLFGNSYDLKNFQRSLIRSEAKITYCFNINSELCFGDYGNLNILPRLCNIQTHWESESHSKWQCYNVYCLVMIHWVNAYYNILFADIAIALLQCSFLFQLYDNAMLAAGLIEDPRSMLGRLNELMSKALEKHWCPLQLCYFMLGIFYH